MGRLVEVTNKRCIGKAIFSVSNPGIYFVKTNGYLSQKVIVLYWKAEVINWLSSKYIVFIFYIFSGSLSFVKLVIFINKREGATSASSPFITYGILFPIFNRLFCCNRLIIISVYGLSVFEDILWSNVNSSVAPFKCVWDVELFQCILVFQWCGYGIEMINCVYSTIKI